MNDPVALKKLNSAIPLGRMAKPEEIGSVVAFVADSGASYITATTISPTAGSCEQPGTLMASGPGITPAMRHLP
jgi:glucose 1-dehydrogenase